MMHIRWLFVVVCILHECSRIERKHLLMNYQLLFDDDFSLLRCLSVYVLKSDNRSLKVHGFVFCFVKKVREGSESIRETGKKKEVRHRMFST